MTLKSFNVYLLQLTAAAHSPDLCPDQPITNTYTTPSSLLGLLVAYFSSFLVCALVFLWGFAAGSGKAVLASAFFGALATGLGGVGLGAAALAGAGAGLAFLPSCSSGSLGLSLLLLHGRGIVSRTSLQRRLLGTIALASHSVDSTETRVFRAQVMQMCRRVKTSSHASPHFRSQVIYGIKRLQTSGYASFQEGWQLPVASRHRFAPRDRTGVTSQGGWRHLLGLWCGWRRGGLLHRLRGCLLHVLVIILVIVVIFVVLVILSSASG